MISNDQGTSNESLYNKFMMNPTENSVNNSKKTQTEMFKNLIELQQNLTMTKNADLRSESQSRDVNTTGYLHQQQANYLESQMGMHDGK